MNRSERRLAIKNARKRMAKGWGEWEDITNDLERLGVPSVEGQAKVWFNNIYLVWVLRFTSGEFGRGVHLMVSRADSKEEDTIPWTHLQRIKNQLAGTSIAALEVYPIESNKVEHNCRHLWCMWPGVDFSWGLHVTESIAKPAPEAPVQTARDPGPPGKKLWTPDGGGKRPSNLLDARGRPVHGGLAPEDFLSPDTA